MPTRTATTTHTVEFRVEPRYLDVTETTVMPDHFNVFVGDRFMGTIVRWGCSVWHAGDGPHDTYRTREAAALSLIARKSRVYPKARDY